MTWIVVPTTNKKGKSLDNQIINLANVLYFREWFTEEAVTEKNPGRSVAYVVGGKEVVIELPMQEVYEIIGNVGQEVRHFKMLSGTEKADTEKA